MIENVIIIGGGAAGLSAAVYLARAGLKPLVFAGSPAGGQLSLTAEVENYPGYESILGAELIMKMRKQAEKFGARIFDKNVVKVDFSNDLLKIYTTSAIDSVSDFPPASARRPAAGWKNRLRAVVSPSILATYRLLSKTIIIATGAKALWLGLESEKRLRGKGVSACATCDGFFFRDKIVAVVGGGDTALEEALTLTKFAKKVYIIHRRDEFRASKVMQERTKSNPKIEVIFNATVEEILGENKVEEIKLKTPTSAEATAGKQNSKARLPSPMAQAIGGQVKTTIRNIKVDGVFIAVGHKPDTELFAKQLALDEKGYVITSARLAIELTKLKTQGSDVKTIAQNSKLKKIIDKFNLNFQSATSVTGVFASGDCADPYYRQAITAAGTGVEAALEAIKYLESRIKY